MGDPRHTRDPSVEAVCWTADRSTVSSGTPGNCNVEHCHEEHLQEGNRYVETGTLAHGDEVSAGRDTEVKTQER